MGYARLDGLSSHLLMMVYPTFTWHLLATITNHSTLLIARKYCCSVPPIAFISSVKIKITGFSSHDASILYHVSGVLALVKHSMGFPFCVLRDG